jgi:hypothetical protein
MSSDTTKVGYIIVMQSRLKIEITASLNLYTFHMQCAACIMNEPNVSPQ